MAKSTSITSYGNGQALVQLGIEVNGKIENLVGSQGQIVYAKIQEGLNSWGTAEFLITSFNNVFVDKVMKTVMSTGVPEVRVRWGIQGSNGPVWTPWQQHFVVNYNANPKGIGNQNGHEVKLETADLLYISSDIQRVGAHKGLISKIVQGIATRMGFDEIVVEPTIGQASYVQSYETDLDFLKERLLPRAVSSKGRGDYRMYVKDNQFHFHTPDFQASLQHLDYFNSNGQALRLNMIDDTQEGEGVAGVKATSYDPYNGVSQIFVSDSKKVLKYGTTMPKLEAFGIGKHLACHLGTNPEMEVQNFVQSLYETERHRLYKLLLMTAKTPFLRINDLLNISISPTNSSSSPWSGYYSVVGVKHIFDRGSLTSSFNLTRGEMTGPIGTFKSLKDLGVDVLEKNLAAPGQDLNLPEVEKSELIQGTGSRVVKVQSPN